MDYLENDKYHGLLNQGATCYLNSVLQVLFMTEDFREAVKRHTCENHTECIDSHLTALFDDLKGHTAYTYKITKKLGIDRVNEQRDAAEYIEKILRLTSPEASEVFHGLLTHKTICSKCHTQTGTDGPFWHLPLALVDSFGEDYSVVNGIEEYFRASYFSGENQMYCDRCDAKSDATIECVIKRHPEVLMLLLKRFEFDYRYMAYVKIDRTVDVPCTLQIPENQTYELYAVVDHSGDLRSGHYTATIKDDERWYKFNDATVTPLDCQPSQVENFEKSSTAYLLFYRKENGQAGDTCTPSIREVSTSGDFSPAGDVHGKCQDARVREEVERAAEAGNDTAVAVSVDTQKETEDIVSGDGVYARENRPNKCQEYNEERDDLHPQDALTKKQRDGGKVTGEEEDMGGNTEADDQAEKRETLSQLEESVGDQGNDSGRRHDVRQRRSQGNAIHNTSYNDLKHKKEVSNMHAKCDYPQQVQQKDKEMVVMNVNRDKDGNMAGGERRGKASTKYLDRDTEHQQNEESGEDYDLKPVSMDTRGGEEMMETDAKVDNEGNTGADEKEMASGIPKLLTKYDLCYPENKNRGRVSDREQSRYKRLEQQRDVDVKGVKEQKRGDDKYAQRRDISMTTPYHTEGVEDQDKRFDGVRQRRSIREDPQRKKMDVKVDKEGKTRANERGVASGGGNHLTKYDLCYYKVQDSGRVGDREQNMPKYDQRYEQGGSHRYERLEQQRDVDVQGAKEQKRGDDKHAQRRETSMTKSCLSEGVEDQDKRFDGVRQRRLIREDPEQKISVKQAKQHENKGDEKMRRAGSDRRWLTENQGDGSVEKTRHGDSQPKARLNEDAMEGRQESKKLRVYDGKIIEEEVRETSSGTQRSSEMKNIRIKTGEGTTQGSIKSFVEYDGGNDPKTETFSLSEDVCNLKLNEKTRTKGLSAARLLDGIKRNRKKSAHEKKRSGRYSSPLKKDSEEKNKKKTSAMCMYCFSEKS